MKPSRLSAGAKSLERGSTFDKPRAGVERTCQECGKSFMAARDCATRTSKFCSVACGHAVQKRKASEDTPSEADLRRLYDDEGMSIEALGKHFGRSAWWAKRALARRGVAERRPMRPQILCAVCGKSFYARPSEVRKGRRFCSIACRGKGLPAPSQRPGAAEKIAAAKRGSKNPQWRGEDTEGSIARVFNVRLKGETNCRNCGTAPSGAAPLHLHHAVPRSMCKAGRRDMRNGITLCARCHHGWHHRTIVIYRDLFWAEEWGFISSLELLGQSISAWLDDRYPLRPATHGLPEAGEAT